MDRPLQHSSIQVRPSLIAGRGVFAEKKINKGDIIEECPVLLLMEEYRSISNYFFEWSETPPIGALPLGYALMYNHADAPNAAWSIDPDQKLFIFRALYDIAADDEIFVNYGEKWFEVRKMVKAQNSFKRVKRYLNYAIKTAIVILIIFVMQWVVTHVKFSII